MDKKALEDFKSFFDYFKQLTEGQKKIIKLKHGGELNIYTPGHRVTAQIELPKKTEFKLIKLGDQIEVWVTDAVMLKEFKVYLTQRKHKFAPDGWTISTQNGDMVTLRIF